MLASLLLTLVTALPQEPGPVPRPETGAVGPTLTGQVVNREGLPVREAQARLRAPKSFRGPGAAGDWRTVDEQGGFELTLPESNANLHFVELRADGFHDKELRITTRRGQQVNLGPMTLEREAMLHGYVLDSDGSLLTEGWEIIVASEPGGRGSSVSRGHRPDPATGRFEVGGLHERTYWVSASGPHTNVVGQPFLAGQAGSPACVLERTGSAVDSRVIVYLQDPLFGGPGRRLSRGGRVALLDDEGEEVVRLSSLDRAGRVWSAAALDADEYTLVFEDPRYQQARIEGVQPGTEHSLRIRGSASLVVDLRDGRGDPLRRAKLNLERKVDDKRQSFLIHDDTTWLPRDGRITGILPGQWTLRMTALDGNNVATTLAELSRGEEQAVELRLPPTGDLRGRLRLADGSPAAGATVEYTAGDLPGTPRGAHGVLLRGRGRVKLPRYTGLVECDAEGRFEIPDLLEGRWTLHARYGAWLAVVEEVGLQHPGIEVDLELPPSGTLRGKLELDDPSHAERVLLFLSEHPTGNWVGALRAAVGRGRIDVAEDGSFQAADVPATELALHARLSNPPLALEYATRASESRRTAAHTWSEHSSEPFPVSEDEPSHQTLDLRNRFGSSLCVHLLVDGASREDLQASLLGPFEQANRTTWTGIGQPAASARPDSEQPLHAFDSLEPGPIRLEISDRSGRWRWRTPDQYDVPTGRLALIKIDVPLRRKRIVLHGPDGRPLAEQAVELALSSASYLERRRTGADGSLEVELPGEGRLELRLVRPDESKEQALEARVAWPDGESKVVLESVDSK